MYFKCQFHIIYSSVFSNIVSEKIENTLLMNMLYITNKCDIGSVK